MRSTTARSDTASSERAVDVVAVAVDPARPSVAALAVVCFHSLKYRVVRVLAKDHLCVVVMDGAKTLRWARRRRQ